MLQAVKSKRLFVLDYHDLFLPYVNKVREQANTTFYGSRTLFFLTDHSTLRPLAIELTRPKSATKPQWREVFVPGYNSTSRWLWKLAKAHVLAHDAGYHQLVIHWYPSIKHFQLIFIIEFRLYGLLSSTENFLFGSLNFFITTKIVRTIFSIFTFDGGL